MVNCDLKRDAILLWLQKRIRLRWILLILWSEYVYGFVFFANLEFYSYVMSFFLSYICTLQTFWSCKSLIVNTPNFSHTVILTFVPWSFAVVSHISEIDAFLVVTSLIWWQKFRTLDFGCLVRAASSWATAAQFDRLDSCVLTVYICSIWLQVS